MVHECYLHCTSMSPEQLNVLGMEKDPGKWLPFMFDMDMVLSTKMSTDNEDDPLYLCSTLYTNNDVFIIDTPWLEFSKLFKLYKEQCQKPNLLQRAKQLLQKKK